MDKQCCFKVTSVPPTIDQRKLRVKQISTGLCIFLFVVSLAFPIYITWMSIAKPITKLVIQNVTKNVTKAIDIKAPTRAQYSQLYSKYPETLTCPCTKASIDYEKFLHIQYTLHEVCNSVFVTQNWISYLAVPTGATLLPKDFRLTSPYSFQGLRTFCDLIKGTISNNLVQFYANQYVSTSVTPLQLFQLETMSRINQFRSSTMNSFLLSLSMIRHTIQGNALFSSLQTNYKQIVQNGDVVSSAVNYQGCSCASLSTCIGQSAIYDGANGTRLFDVPGFYTGCYVIESLLQSDLQCFYDQTCVNVLQTYLSSSMNVTALNSLLPSIYSVDSTIKELLDGLMIEQWDSTINYERYYAECQPIQCTYSVEMVETVQTIDTVKTRADPIYIVGMLISIVGGLIAILQLIIPRLVKCIVYGLRKPKMRVVSHAPTVQM